MNAAAPRPAAAGVPASAAAGRWLGIVGLGEDGVDGLSPAARRLVAGADLVVGGARHLALAADLIAPGAATLTWPSPLTDAFPAILARRGRAVVVLATGDPFFHGVGSLLTRLVDAGQMLCLPAPSAYALACARLGWAGQDVVRLSLHGRALAQVRRHLHPGARLLALSWDGETPRRLAELLSAEGFGSSRLTVLEAMGGLRERVTETTAAGFDLGPADPLNTVALEIVADPGARVLPLSPGLPDDWFENDGQITKREVRAMTLAALAPRRGEMLFDIGAGSGSVAIEWMLADPSLAAVAIERDAARASRIGRNAVALGVPDLAVVTGAAPVALGDLGEADAVFIGGGATVPGLIDAAFAALRPGGRLVVNAVTLETQALLAARYAADGGDLTEIAIARAGPVGGFHAFRPAMTVVQWRREKPHAR
ncbi:precorrin-6y C5,15-methyltransferase (decarboxylating) subunit CbiE [Methylobrevis albus]|uniref:Precorrin-6y C5,15-methyltransferase (Decarboxylating) subunit CbiE n=1 Tax=Methylobrevis albus TaxID=2793297 RepID=A0A931HZP3_9HYPH|nr:precorrin-6y C5,15-methyltransferase (decarboxylating) subunit CbiE [Methylobrevis albus]MBH0236286.1 precorrin-6y C5,15-methyltransferase (decarboxylating) subunit CbiE [Methylobrevis albus]